MDRQRALQLLTSGPASVERWNRWRTHHPEPPSLAHCNLRGAQLSHADLSCVDLTGADLSNTVLFAACFRRANLTRARLKLADLCQARFDEALLVDANLRKANLCGASFKGAVIRRVDFTLAECDQATTWPADFDPRRAGLTPWPPG